MNHRDQQMMEEWQEEDDFDADAYMQSKEYLVDKLLVSALDDICRLVDMAKHREYAKILKDRKEHLIMMGKRWTELWGMIKGPDYHDYP